MTYELSGEDIQPYAPNTLVKAEISQNVSSPDRMRSLKKMCQLMY